MSLCAGRDRGANRTAMPSRYHISPSTAKLARAPSVQEALCLLEICTFGPFLMQSAPSPPGLLIYCIIQPPSSPSKAPEPPSEIEAAPPGPPDPSSATSASHGASLRGKAKGEAAEGVAAEEGGAGPSNTMPPLSPGASLWGKAKAGAGVEGDAGPSSPALNRTNSGAALWGKAKAKQGIISPDASGALASPGTREKKNGRSMSRNRMKGEGIWDELLMEGAAGGGIAMLARQAMVGRFIAWEAKNARASRINRHAGMLGICGAYSVFCYFIFVYGVKMYENIGPGAELEFITSWFQYMAFDNFVLGFQDAFKAVFYLNIAGAIIGSFSFDSISWFERFDDNAMSRNLDARIGNRICVKGDDLGEDDLLGSFI
mmetsp:Transcript_38809/g.123281  ORF Transcript_38809/g.123281 Transcript_38809/m.123281 type:complete len:373 (+) Transcript_38809:3824-4942(+)